MGKTYTLGQAAARLGITAEELGELVRDNALHVSQNGSQKVLDAAEVDALAARTPRRPERSLGDTGTEDAISLSEADRSILEGLGGGSGLLELTRERYETSLGDVRYNIQMEAPLETKLPAEAAAGKQTWMALAEAAAALGLNVRTVEGLLEAGELTSRLRPDGQREVLVAAVPAGNSQAQAVSQDLAERQIQIARTALGMARKLAETHEYELKRARRNAFLAWVAAGVLAVGGGLALGWAVHRTHDLNVSRITANSLTNDLQGVRALLEEEKARTAGLNEDLRAAQADRRSLQADKDRVQGDLTTAREALAESKAAAQILSADLATAKTKAAEMSAELERLRTEKAASQPAENRAGL